MFPQKMKVLVGYLVMLATVPAAIILAPQIGAWTIAMVLGAGALGGWLTLDSAAARTSSPEKNPIEDEDYELPTLEKSIYFDPMYQGIPGNVYTIPRDHE